MKLEIRAYDFTDMPGMPLVHEDERRKVYETVERTPQGIKRTVRLVLQADNVTLGNHYHTFTEEFTGQGEGWLYTAPQTNPTNITKQALPTGGWAFTVPPGLIHAVVLRKSTLHITTSPALFEEGVNTFRAVIAS